MRRAGLVVVLMTFLCLSLSAGVFSGYDFSYQSSVNSDSLYAFSSDKFGLDYTGYGYLGDMTSGLYLRLGFQVPFATVQTLLDSDEPAQPPAAVPDATLPGPGGNAGIDENIPDDPRFTSFQILASIGPSFRKFVSPELSWYMGIGFKLDQTRMNTRNREGETIELENNVSVDLDFGYRVALHEHVTMRIGAYLTRPLFRLGVTTFLGMDEGEIENENNPSPEPDDKTGKPVYDFQQTIFTPIGEKSGVKYSGYISLGYTFASFQEETLYRYRITSPEYGTGSMEQM